MADWNLIGSPRQYYQTLPYYPGQMPQGDMLSRPVYRPQPGDAQRYYQPMGSGVQGVSASPVYREQSGSDPASIRYNNPGAMYPGSSATRYGSTGFGTIGGGHKIAQFASPEAGAAAQFDLLSRGYVGMPLSGALTKWSGGNSSPEYVASVARQTGLSPSSNLTGDMLRDPNIAIPLARAMAQVEAGRPYPMSGEQWAAAHRQFLGSGQNAFSATPGAGWRDAPPMTGKISTIQPQPQTSSWAQGLNAFAPQGATWGSGGNVTWNDGSKQQMWPGL